MGAGAVLSQRSSPDGELHPCAIFSRRFTSAERNYGIGDRKLLAMKLALEEWRHWLEGAGHPVLVWTDHKNLEFIRSAKRLNSRQARWALFFEGFDLHIAFRPGVRNGKPDALSRVPGLPALHHGEPPIISASSIVAPVLWGIVEEVRRATLSARVPPGGPPGRHFVPARMRPKVLAWAHASHLTCHPGRTRTLRFLQRQFWWPRFRGDVDGYVAACSICAQNKRPNSRPVGLLMLQPVPRWPWSHISLDRPARFPGQHGHSGTGGPVFQGRSLHRSA